MACRFTELVIDAHDPASLGRFWAQVLGYDIVEEKTHGTERYVELQGPPASGPRLLVLEVPDDKVTKNRLHIDVNPTDRSQEEEVERILALGARRVDVGQGEQTWVVLADPEGNEFCVLRSRVGATGGAAEAQA